MSHTESSPIVHHVVGCRVKAWVAKPTPLSATRVDGRGSGPPRTRSASPRAAARPISAERIGDVDIDGRRRTPSPRSTSHDLESRYRTRQPARVRSAAAVAPRTAFVPGTVRPPAGDVGAPGDATERRASMRLNRCRLLGSRRALGRRTPADATLAFCLQCPGISTKRPPETGWRPLHE